VAEEPSVFMAQPTLCLWEWTGGPSAIVIGGRPQEMAASCSAGGYMATPTPPSTMAAFLIIMFLALYHQYSKKSGVV